MKKIFLLTFAFLSMAACCFAKDIDLAISEVILPDKIFQNKRANVTIVLVNNSDMDIEDCQLTIEATDGSKITRPLPLPKGASQKVELIWVPLKDGKIDFKVTLAAPKGTVEKNTENNQITKTVTVVAAPAKK